MPRSKTDKKKYATQPRTAPKIQERQQPLITCMITTVKEYLQLKTFSEVHGLRGLDANVKNHLTHDYDDCIGAKRIGYQVLYPYAIVHLRDHKEPNPPELMVMCNEGSISREEALDDQLETQEEIAATRDAIRASHDDGQPYRYPNNSFVGVVGPGIRLYGLQDIIRTR